jgi:hypothetical protein
MPYVDRLYRVNINAETPGEITVNTVWVRADTITNSAVTAQRVADKVRDSWGAMVTAGLGGAVGSPMAPFFANGTIFRSVTAYKVNALGKSVEQAEAPFGATVKGTGSQALPAQCALVTTLLTGAPGRSARGRLFLGGLSTFLDGSGRVLPASQLTIAKNMAGFYVDVRSTATNPDDFRPVVVSPTTTTARKITRIQVGNVMDTMRSRRGKLVEGRVSETVDE